VFPSGGCPAKMQTRGKTAFAFGKANVFANSSAKTPNVVIGRASNPAGILDLNGYDQSVPIMTITAANNQDNRRQYAPENYFTSENAATLTVTRGFAGTGISSRLCDKKCIAAGDFAEITRRAKVFMDITRAHE